jgi:hypothetical protein
VRLRGDDLVFAARLSELRLQVELFGKEVLDFSTGGDDSVGRDVVGVGGSHLLLLRLLGDACIGRQGFSAMAAA